MKKINNINDNKDDDGDNNDGDDNINNDNSIIIKNKIYNNNIN